ncbi:hypothetical protein KXW39_005495 [Aspergillus fumigatus]|uniref:Ecp2 effector protein-like domain-containing protein n=1 Tax=Aspergillus fumigatus TaxID=746128 RepID=A0A9P8NAI5_ASPFM|nr:hypothetical protein KXX32_004056 [Aspergillus fumigatus]KAH1509494.1 hypothetical protein KXX29_005643 [Aspergillus fumigatus]KAH1607451.1 hypothetical protein KXX21_005341 [Aspergillus fumigatus]KAH1638354.1 hypothetical protein KXX39_005507 [Aspergillus fumigatus]KAH1658306.1 hypothetical protein KXX65_005612 [Aspergillus fumigatus]
MILTRDQSACTNRMVTRTAVPPPTPATAGRWRTSTVRTSQLPASSAAPVSRRLRLQGLDQSGRLYTNVVNYPCIPHQAPNRCGDLTCRRPDQGRVLQCVGLHTGREEYPNTDGERKVEKAIGSQDQPVQFGSCAFGVQAQGTDGNVDFHIGVQDIVDIITDSVRQFGGLGRMVLRGVRSGDETVNGQQVEWELYLY